MQQKFVVWRYAIDVSTFFNVSTLKRSFFLGEKITRQESMIVCTYIFDKNFKNEKYKYGINLIFTNYKTNINITELLYNSINIIFPVIFKMIFRNHKIDSMLFPQF